MNAQLPATRLPAVRGWHWIVEGWRLFMRKPLTWIVFTVITWLFVKSSAAHPLLMAAASVVLPVLLGGWATAIRAAEAGRSVPVNMLFSGFRERFGDLSAIGAVSLMGNVMLWLVMFALVGDLLTEAVTRPESLSPEQAQELQSRMSVALVIMLALGNFVRNQFWVLIIAMLLIAGCARFAWASAAFREKFDAFWLTLPLLGKLARGYNAARFASTLAMLAGAGVPILKALQAAADTLSNRAMRTDALDALVLVREGAPLASALARHPRFPGLLAMFARLGEQTGELPQMLQRAAQQLAGEVQRRAMQFATLLEPLLIVTMGLVVMLIVLAVLLPIIQMNQLVK